MFDKEKIRNSIDFKEFYLKHLSGIKMNGKTQVMTICPFHQDKIASLSINLSKGSFRCFGCGARGDIFDFYMKKYGVDFPQALKDLAAVAGVEEVSNNPSFSIDNAADKFHSNLKKDQLLKRELIDKRAWANDVMDKYKIGYDYGSKTFTIPIYSKNGGVFNIKKYKLFRQSSEPKMFWHRRGSGEVLLYPFNSLKSETIYITEGEPDALCLLSKGFPAITGTAGAETWKESWNSYFQHKNVVILYDNDEAGRSGAAKVAQGLFLIAKSIKVIQWPSFMLSGEDITDFFVKYKKTPEDLLKIIEEAPVWKPESQISIKDVEEAVKTIDPELVGMTNAAMAMCATLSFKQNKECPVLIFVGPSGSAKTMVLSFFFPVDKNSDLNKYIFRSDSFTPKSFVSGAVNVPKKELPNIDLLPKLKNKIFLSKELAPIFRGHKDDKVDVFSILISVLDGKGYERDTGTRGHRGYSEDIFFCWLGGTTPLTNEIFKLMAQLGTRLFFYSTDRKPKSINSLVEYGMRKDKDTLELECQRVVNSFLSNFFKKYPPRSFDEREIMFDEEKMKWLVLYVRIMCHLRAAFSYYHDEYKNKERYQRPEKEHEFKAIRILSKIAKGNALIHGRNYIDELDIFLIREITLSSMPEPRRLTFEALLKYGGTAKTMELVKKVGYAKGTAIQYMRELSHLGMCDLDESFADEDSFILKLKPEFQEILDIENKLKEAVQRSGGVCAGVFNDLPVCTIV